jgi:hypothetical protein
LESDNGSAAYLGQLSERQFDDFLLDDLNDLFHDFPPRAFVV